MSPIQGNGLQQIRRHTAGHAQVATGAEDPAVRLCDPATGGFTHVLTGHRGAVWAAAWSRTSEWHLATGASDGQVLALQRLVV